ncbi:MAG: hypothetical protein ISN29_10050 [Gammaproteobacteria bacterium AqS3]|nr:hypothetical protein [Gammaproteobacteria bacterium AqS3]
MSEIQKKIIEKFKKVRRSAVGGHLRPHKPLLMLVALGMIASGNTSRLNSFSEIKPKLQNLLDKFGRPGEMHDPRNPFEHLKSDGVWEVSDGDKGGFADWVYEEFQKDPSFIFKAAEAVLSETFPNSLHEIVLADAGIRLGILGYTPSLAWQSGQDANFVGRVMAAYAHKCAVCSYDTSLDGNLFGLDVAHIQWSLCDGPDEVNNGLVLCKTHRSALDFGAISIDENFKILVSKKLEGNPEIRHFLFDRFANKPLMRPNNPEDLPDTKYLKWHHEWVFKGA